MRPTGDVLGLSRNFSRAPEAFLDDLDVFKLWQYPLRFRLFFRKVFLELCQRRLARQWFLPLSLPF